MQPAFHIPNQHISILLFTSCRIYILHHHCIWLLAAETHISTRHVPDLLLPAVLLFATKTCRAALIHPILSIMPVQFLLYYCRPSSLAVSRYVDCITFTKCQLPFIIALATRSTHLQQARRECVVTDWILY